MIRLVPAFLCIVLLNANVAIALSARPLELYVDLVDAPKRLFHANLTIPVDPGPMELVYPRWGIPTYEAPASVLDNIVGLRILANGKPIAWKRDPVNFFSFHINVPAGINSISISLDVVAPPQRSDLNAATGQLLVLDWQTLVLYPAQSEVSKLPIKPSIRLPKGWRQASALTLDAIRDDMMGFKQVSLDSLVDSPVLAGPFFQTVEVDNHSQRKVFVDIAADLSQSAWLPKEWLVRIQRLVNESGVLFGSYPYKSYRFLVALSDQVGNDGLEHRESTDLRLSTRAFLDDNNRLAYGYLLPHEYVHAWNGKFRLPEGLSRKDYQTPQTTELLWVYEGFTRYLNWVLAARSGILSESEAHDYLALLAAKTTHRSGRAWRSLQDTAISAGILNDAPDQWESLRRGTDYYDEALLIWLEADMLIRQGTHGERSLDDFCKLFFGQKPNDPPLVKTYTFDDVVSALNAVFAHDWRTFLRARLDATGDNTAPLDGLSAGGWKLVYQNTPGSVQAARDKVNKTVEERFSIGALLANDGGVTDVVRDSAAWDAGIAPGMKILSINGKPWSPEALFKAILRAIDGSYKIKLKVENGAETFDATLNYLAGARYPRLERTTREDLIAHILRPRNPS